MKKKKVLFVINAMGRAGAEKVLIALFQTLDKQRIDIDFLSVINRGEMFSEIPDHINVINKNPVADSLLTGQGKTYLMRYVMKALFLKGMIFKLFPHLIRNTFLQIKRGRLMFDKLFWRVLSESTPKLREEYDLAIAFTEGASTYYVADRVRAKKKIAYIHVDYTKAGYLKSLDKRFYDKIDTIFSVSSSVLDNFVALYPEFENRTQIFQNVILPQDIFDAAEKEGGFTDNFDGIRLLTVARLHPQKAIEVAIPAFAKLVSMGYDNVKWYILGEGPERPILEKLIEQHGLQDKFILFGAVTNPYPFMRQCDIYLQASHFEGWCIALAEALVLCRPTIASECTGNREQIVSEKNGLLIDLSEENLANALKRLIDDIALREQFTKTLAGWKVDYAKDVKLLYDILELPYSSDKEKE